MGLSGSKSTTGPSKFAKPYIKAAANEAQSVYDQNKGANAEIATSIQGLLPGVIDKYNAGNPAVKAATDYTTGVLGGQYAQGNPYLEQMIGRTADDVTDRVSGSLGTRGRTGGDAHSAILGRELATAENGMRYQDYSAERDRMAQAAGMAPGLAVADYAGIIPALSVAEAGAELPYAGINSYAGNIGGLLGQYTTTKNKQGIGSALLGAASQAAGAFAASGSDRRLKKNIERVGELEDGLGVYAWDYRHDLGIDLPAGRHTGVMVDEVEKLRPWALGPKINGEYGTVIYGVL